MNRFIFFEVMLVLFSVFIFRSFWVWLDRCPWLDTDAGLGVSLVIGMIGSVWALKNLNKCVNKG